jgi:alpha-aminoadipic semialdehyde synthase
LLNLKWIYVLKELPHEYVPPNMLQKVAMRGDTNKLYATEISRYT